MIEREERDGIVTLRLAHGKANVLDLELCQAITNAMRDEAGSRAIVLTGIAKIFSAGVDLIRLTSEGAPYIERFFPALAESLMALLTFPRPLVAAINGHAIAGGCLVSLTADYRVMCGGTIGGPELSVGVPFPAIAIEILRFAAGAYAHRLATFGEIVAPHDAKSRRLVDEVVDTETLIPHAFDIAKRLATVPDDAFRLTKANLRQPYVRAAAAHAKQDAEALEVWSSPETIAHIQTYLQRTLRKS